MPLVTETSLREVLASLGPIPAGEAWPELSARCPDVLQFLLRRKGALGRMDDHVAKLSLIVLDALPGLAPALAVLERSANELLRDGCEHTDVLAQLRSCEPELAALLAFFVQSVDGYATPGEKNASCAAVATVALALLQTTRDASVARLGVVSLAATAGGQALARCPTEPELELERNVGLRHA